jgi:hypothetical protein
MAEREVLEDTILVGLVDDLGCAERAAALGVFGGHQVPFTRAHADSFATASDLKPFGYSFARFNSLGASHIQLLSQKERET